MNVGVGAHATAVPAGQGNRHQAARLCRRQCCFNVFRTPTRRYSERHVTRATEALDLTAENVLVAVIVRDSSDDIRVRRQRDSSQRPPVALESPDELAGKMLRIGRASAVAECKHLPASGQSTADCGGGGDDATQTVPGEALMRRDGFVENRAN